MKQELITLKNINTNKNISLQNNILKIKQEKNKQTTLIIKNINKNTQILLEKNSQLRIFFIYEKEIKLNHNIICEENSKIEFLNFITKNAELTIETKLKDYASCNIINNYYGKEKEIIIKNTVIHEGKNSKSKINTTGYLINSKSEIHTLIKIKKEAFNAQGYQESKAYLEKNSNSISLPDLEILNNEVQCSHSSTITRIKEEDLFYFEARGINKKEARKMLIKGLVLKNFEDKEIKLIEQIINKK